MTLGRRAALDQASASIFRIPYLEGRRNGERILMGHLEGPQLKSYWPNKARDIMKFAQRSVSSEIPLAAARLPGYMQSIKSAFSVLPVSLHHVYRENMTDWRKRRGGALKKGSLHASVLLLMCCRRGKSHDLEHWEAEMNPSLSLSYKHHVATALPACAAAALPAV